MNKFLARCSAIVLLAYSGNSTGFAQDNVTIPLSGTLEGRCSIETQEPLLANTPSAVEVTVRVTHRCNARSTLVVSISPQAIATETGFRATYNGIAPSAMVDGELSFFQDGPVDNSFDLELVLSDQSRDKTDALLQNLHISVESF